MHGTGLGVRMLGDRFFEAPLTADFLVPGFSHVQLPSSVRIAKKFPDIPLVFVLAQPASEGRPAN